MWLQVVPALKCNHQIAFPECMTIGEVSASLLGAIGLVYTEPGRAVYAAVTISILVKSIIDAWNRVATPFIFKFRRFSIGNFSDFCRILAVRVRMACILQQLRHLWCETRYAMRETLDALLASEWFEPIWSKWSSIDVSKGRNWLPIISEKDSAKDWSSAIFLLILSFSFKWASVNPSNFADNSAPRLKPAWSIHLETMLATCNLDFDVVRNIHSQDRQT